MSKFTTEFYKANGIRVCPNGDKMRSRSDGTLFCPGEDDVKEAESNLSAGNTEQVQDEKPKSETSRARGKRRSGKDQVVSDG